MYFSCKKANFRVFCVVLPDRLMVGLIPLEDSILVRVQVWQQKVRSNFAVQTWTRERVGKREFSVEEGLGKPPVSQRSKVWLIRWNI